MKNYLKRTTTFVLALLMLLSVPLQAFAEVDHNNLSKDKAEIINENKLDVKVAKPEEGKTAEALIKNPDQPAIYTLRTDFKVPVENSHKISYQPYIASVGANASDAEKAKVDKTIDLPELVGFEQPDYEENFSVNYQDIVNEAKNATKTEDKVNGDRYTANQEFRYREISRTIQVKDVFQDINDFNKYEPKLGNETRPVSGSTGSALQVPALQDYEIKGFVPEERSITVQLPWDTKGYVVEYRYNRNHYEVTFDTDGGTPVQAREFFYGQKIPALGQDEVPTQNGKRLLGWDASPTLKDKNGKPYTAGHLKSDLSGDLIMPAGSVTFKAVWQNDSSASAKPETKKTEYKVRLDYDNGKASSNKEYTINHDDKFAKPRTPYRKGYTFMGWAWIDKNSAGKVLYSFNNPVTSDINLKALWVKNDRVDLDIYHYFLDKDGNKDNSKYLNPLKETLYDKRVGNYSTTVGDQISDKYTLASPDDIKDANIKSIFDTYNTKYKFNNSFFQTIMVEADNSNGANTFYFFYKPFRTREYKVNYIDERFKNDPANGAIIPQELVENGNRHYDARNYRPIPGWKLTSAPQQQLFFDVDEKTNELKGINSTGKDEITFYYKDVRVIEVPENDPVPEGYVRVTFKADKGGAFIDKAGNSKTELYYDVINGLKSQFLPVPQELKEGDTKEEGKYYITSDNGRNFKEWADAPLLNDNVIIEQNYSFTAKFDWSGLTAKPMVVTEAFKDANGKWTNDFAPTLADLKNQIVWMENGVEQALPSDATVTFEGITKDEDIYKKLKELGVSDKDQVFRIVTFKAKVEFKDKKNTKELEIPVKVYKNRYEALTSGDKPLPLSEAEKKDLKDILKDTAEKRYIKVTVNPSNKPDNKDSKIYYVNPKAWVDIPEIKLTAEDKAKLKFLNWTSDDVTKNDNGQANGVYDFAKRFKFTKDTIISPVSAKDVIEQKEKDKNIPESYVKVIVKTTDNATDQTKFERTFWVDPLNKVEISVDKPTGKKIESDTTAYTLTFSKWQTEDKSKSWTDKILGQFEKNTTILAKYSTKFQDIKVQKPTADVIDTPQGKVPTLDEIKAKIKAPEGKTIASVEYITNGEPDVNKDGKAEAKVIVKYTDGSKVGSNDNPIKVPVEVHKNIIPSYDGNMPEGALKNYVKITFKAGTGGTITDGKKQAYFVSPEVEVDMTSIANGITKTPDTGYVNDTWDKDLKGKFKKNTEFIFNFKKTPDIVKVTDSSVQKPEGYAELIFSTDGNGKLDDNKDKITYYVNPKAGIKIVNGTAGDKQISVPTPKANSNYEFEKWREDLNFKDSITADRHYVAGFKLTNVTLTYDPNGGIGKGPSAKTVEYGTREFLANQEKLTKENYNFIGWKLDTGDTDRIYKPGEDIVLTANTTATAQWKIIQHTVSFNTMGGSPIDSQEVDHGSTAKNPENPTKAGFVFMGWKENTSDKDYFNFTTKITADKTLVAIWEKAVQKIGENDPVGEEFIKVKFEEGKHGSLEGDTLYKVGKDLSFEDAVKYGLVVPKINPAKYYKAKAENLGWDKALALKGQNVTFTAQYEPEADVIPIDPKTSDEDIKKEKPEGMVVVDFKVEPNKFYMVGTTKFYVKIRELVNITPPVVLNRDTKFVFKGWTNANVVDDKINQTFTEDYTITDAEINELDLIITIPKEGQSRVFIEKLSGQKGKLQVISDGSNTSYENSTFRRRGKTYDVFNLDSPLKVGDILKYWAEDENRSSLPKQEMVK
ncbi:MAG: InlB B-repeat-containing protein [Peptoniphilus lacrimalis]|uniref:InlB B-repeat-containing protein n=1 Tax=Peptoniphilus lacrimalis TaxID=33031 RepID=UPI00254C9187|nr:InlB B-repeat-containing protein [Peptoniphilus lacrimalis]MDK8281339.1 InlB B-repeat-containing protein [Peptoniphilus lacrimalis]